MAPKSSQLQIVTIGLQGSGKTTTCFSLSQLLDARWLNQDEFAFMGHRARKAFLDELSRESSLPNQRPLIVDRINTMSVHRTDVFGAMQSVGVRVIVEWDMSVRDCITRVKERQFGHRSILPGHNVSMILARTGKDYSPLTEEEISRYQVRKVIRIENARELTREQVVQIILDGLTEFNRAYESVSDEQIASVISLAREREAKIARENEKTQATWSAPRVEEGRYEILMKTSRTLIEYLNFFSDGSDFKPKSEFHVTLLFMNRALARFISGVQNKESQSSGTSTPNSDDSGSHTYTLEEYRSALTKFKNLANQNILVKPRYIAKNNRVMALKVDITDTSIPHFNVVPHVSLGKIPDAEFRECNHLIELVEKLRSEGHNGSNEDQSITWIDVGEIELLPGKIRFTNHRSKQ